MLCKNSVKNHFNSSTQNVYKPTEFARRPRLFACLQSSSRFGVTTDGRYRLRCVAPCTADRASMDGSRVPNDLTRVQRDGACGTLGPNFCSCRFCFLRRASPPCRRRVRV